MNNLNVTFSGCVPLNISQKISTSHLIFRTVEKEKYFYSNNLPEKLFELKNCILPGEKLRYKNL